MKINAKLILILTFCAMATACTSTKTLDRTLVQQQKVKTVNLNLLDENISIDKTRTGVIVGGVAGGLIGGAIGAAVDSGTNARRKEGLSLIQQNINNINANAVLKNALQHNLVGNAFNDDLVILTAFDESDKKPYLTPVLKPSIVMSPNYSAFEVELKASTAYDSQKRYKATYSSQKLANTSTGATKEQNKQFWADNPLILKEKLVDALYDVSKQFADDFNSQ